MTPNQSLPQPGSPFLHTKFLAPQPGPDQVARPHLVAWLTANRHRRLILISAPAGYGKTTLLRDLVVAEGAMPGQGMGSAVAWYQLDATDNDPSVFLGCLVEAMRRGCLADPAASSFGQATLALLAISEDPAISLHQIMTVLVNELFEALTGSWTIVLEDYHHITSPAVHQAVAFLLENGPPGLHTLLSTRLDPPLPLARLRARGHLAELRAGDLRFRPQEIEDWVRQQVPTLSAAALATLADKTEGWAAAVQIVLSSIQGRDAASAQRFIATLSGSQHHFFDYLAEEIFRRLPPHQQEFLLSTAILEQMDAPLCNALLGRDASDPGTHDTLRALEQANLFLSTFQTEGQWFRYHQLFREFLVGKLRREDAQKLAALHRRAAAYYAAAQDWEKAFPHFLLAGEHEAGARALEQFAPDYVEQGRVEVINRYLSELAPAVLADHPNLLMQRGNVLRRLGQAGGAVASYEEARRTFMRHGDHAGVCRVLSRLAEVNYAQGHYGRSEALAREALALATADDHAGRCQALIALAKNVGLLQGMDAGRSLAEQAVAEADQAGDQVTPTARANLLQSLGQICWWHGDPQATVAHCQAAIQTVPEQLSPITAKAYLTMVTPYLYWRELETALHCAEQGLEMAQTLHLVELMPSAYTALGNVLTRLGEASRAESALRQAMETADRLGLASYERVMAAGYLAYNLSGQGRLDEARQLVEGALGRYAGHPDTYEVYVFRSVLADIALEKGDLAGAEALFRQLIPTGERRHFHIALAMVYFGLAYICLQTERSAAGLDYGRRSLALIEPTGALQLFLDQGERGRTVCQALLAAGVRSRFVERVLAGLHPDAQAAAALRVEPKAVIVKMLGTFQVFVDGREVTQEAWVSAKARDLLAYFVTFRNERIPVERVFDALWSERAGRSRTAFHTALSRLRKALRRDEETLKFILVESGEYWLDAARFSVDVDEFDSALAKARAAQQPETAAHWYAQALAMVNGEYLDNLYYEWVLPERRRLGRDHLHALCQLAHLRADAGDHAAALDLLRQALVLDPLLEEVHCQIMRAQAALGNRGQILRQYQALEAVLAAELGVAPLPATQALFRQLTRQ